MYARIQTWFPFNIQVGLNGREWLARQMDQQGLKYRQQGNCFVWIEDYEEAQKLMRRQLEMNWAELLNGFGGQLNPLHESLFAHYPASYYWTCYQSEWATDIVFAEADSLRRIMALLVRHGMLSFSSADVMRYFGRRVNQSGDIPANFNGMLETDLKRRQEGERVKYRMNGNSAKFYDKAYSEIGSVLRGAETTINAVQDFRAYRSKEGGPEEEDLQWRPLRKGIADLHRRAEVSQKANERLLNSLASVDDSRSVEELTAGIQKHTHWNGRRVRGVRPWAEDKELFTAINHGEFLINGFRNRDLQKLLYTTEAESQVNRRRRSSTISRKLRLLRAHGLIQKVPRTHRYHVTEAGRAILVAVLTAARTSVNQLNQLAKAA
jgi:DNA-binding PadR family transcriptional regulator